MLDLSPAPANAKKFRRDWGLQNMVGANGPMPAAGNLMAHYNREAQGKRNANTKIAKFIRTAVYPQQLTIPRQYATTREGCWVYKILEGREMLLDPHSKAKYREKGVRVVVQENARQARFVISPLFDSTHDALGWARQEMGAEM